MKILTKISFPFIFSILFTALIVLAFVRPGYKYTLEIRETYIKSSSKGELFFTDLNGDGLSEKIHKYHFSESLLAMIVYNSDGDLVEQYNFPGNMPDRSHLSFFDADKDSLQESYFFTYIGDSLFLNIAEFYNEGAHESVFLDIAPLENGEPKYIISNFLFDTVDQSNPRLYFSISAAFALTPRHIYSYNINTRDVNRSPMAGNTPRYLIRSFDIDQDGSNEYFGTIYASDNYHTPIPYSDQKAWVMVYSDQLEYEFPPIPYGDFTSSVIINPVRIDENFFWSAACGYRGNQEEIMEELMLINPEGEIFKKINLNNHGLHEIYLSFVYNNQIYIIDLNGNAAIFNTDLELVGFLNSDNLIGSKLSGPFLLDGIEEPLYLGSKGNELHMLDIHGNKVAEDNISGIMEYQSAPQVVKDFKGFTGYYINLYDRTVIFDLHNTKRWLWFTLKVSLIFIVTLGILLLLQVIQKKQDKKRATLINKLREYQLITAKKQIDPHFMFNALNAISSMNLKGNVEASDEYLTRLSDLMREVLIHSDKSIIPLSEEMNLIRKQLFLEELRLGKDFKYSIDIPDALQATEIPAMSVHTFVENAIKHGLAGREGDKKLLIEARRVDKEVVLIIEDNGRGYHPENNRTNSTGKGYDILRQMFFAYHQITGRKIEYSRSESENGGVKITMHIETK